MPIQVKELIVRAWINSQSGEQKQEAKKVQKSGSEVTAVHAEMLEQLKRMLTDKKDR